MPSPQTHIVPAPAKINLHLTVTATLNNGYHSLDTSFAYVDIADQLHITPSEHIQVNCSSPHLEGENNLVYRVLKALQEQYHINDGLSVFIDKKIPEQGGLGGGSSDAATAILMANKIWRLQLSREQLISFASPFGADIPCFLYGTASQAYGMGEELSDYPHPLPKGHVLLAHPGIGLSTQAVFGHYDKHHPLTPHNVEDNIRDRSHPALGKNDLEQAACSLAPKVEKLLASMQKACNQSWMSGSGSSCVALLDSKDEALALANDLTTDHLATWTHVGKLLAEHPMHAYAS